MAWIDCIDANASRAPYLSFLYGVGRTEDDSFDWHALEVVYAAHLRSANASCLRQAGARSHIPGLEYMSPGLHGLTWVRYAVRTPRGRQPHIRTAPSVTTRSWTEVLHAHHPETDNKSVGSLNMWMYGAVGSGLWYNMGLPHSRLKPA